MKNLFIHKALPLAFTLLLVACQDNSERYLRVGNASNEWIVAQFVSRGNGWEIFREKVKPHRAKEWGIYDGEEIWGSLIEEQGGWIVRIYPDSLFSVPHDSLKTIPPLKQWEVKEWQDIVNLDGTFEYP
jgi:hypothetical protein